jgi:hypothetical protein
MALSFMLPQLAMAIKITLFWETTPCRKFADVSAKLIASIFRMECMKVRRKKKQEGLILASSLFILPYPLNMEMVRSSKRHWECNGL